MGKKREWKREQRRRIRQEMRMLPDWVKRAQMVDGLRAMNENPSLDKNGKLRRLVERAISALDARNPYGYPDAPWGGVIKVKQTLH